MCPSTSIFSMHRRRHAGASRDRAPAGNAVPRLVPRLENTSILTLWVGCQGVPHLQTIVPRLCPGLFQKLAPPQFPWNLGCWNRSSPGPTRIGDRIQQTCPLWPRRLHGPVAPAHMSLKCCCDVAMFHRISPGWWRSRGNIIRPAKDQTSTEPVSILRTWVQIVNRLRSFDGCGGSWADHATIVITSNTYV
jgi:hypothetical protein